MMKKLPLMAILAVFGLTPDGLRAAEFSNTYIRFVLPDDWQCSLEVDSFVCREIGVEANRPAMLIVTAKETNPATDNFDVYAAEVSRPRRMQDRSGNAYTSRPDPARRESIGGREWIIGRQFGSEVPNYYTYYYATIEGRVAVLFTMTYHSSYEASVLGLFRRTTRSLTVSDPISGRNPNPESKVKPPPA